MSKFKQLLAAVTATAMLLTTAAFAAELPANGDYTMEASYKRTNDLETDSTMVTYIDTTVAVTVDDRIYSLTFDYLNYLNMAGITGVAFSQIQQSVDGEWVDVTISDVTDEYDDGYDHGRFTLTVNSLETITLNAYVDVMANMGANPWTTFVVVPDVDSLTLVELAGDSADTSTESMTITASVAKNVATSSVVIPESMDMGELSKTEDTVVSYAAEINEGYGQTVTVSADNSVTLTAGDATLTLANDFDGKTGTLTATAEDVAAVASFESDLDFAGSLTFTISVA